MYYMCVYSCIHDIHSLVHEKLEMIIKLVETHYLHRSLISTGELESYSLLKLYELCKCKNTETDQEVEYWWKTNQLCNSSISLEDGTETD